MPIYGHVGITCHSFKVSNLTGFDLVSHYWHGPVNVMSILSNVDNVKSTWIQHNWI